MKMTEQQMRLFRRRLKSARASKPHTIPTVRQIYEYLYNRHPLATVKLIEHVSRTKNGRSREVVIRGNCVGSGQFLLSLNKPDSIGVSIHRYSGLRSIALVKDVLGLE